jgi:predicted acyl esterase
MSYFAVIQYLAAAQQPPHLKAIFPYLGFTDFYRHFAYHGGALVQPH